MVPVSEAQWNELKNSPSAKSKDGSKGVTARFGDRPCLAGVVREGKSKGSAPRGPYTGWMYTPTAYPVGPGRGEDSNPWRFTRRPRHPPERSSPQAHGGRIGFSRGSSPRSVTFVSHVHPDPDSLGSMLGLAHLVECRLGKPTRLTRDGLISRAENRAMVELLDLDLDPDRGRGVGSRATPSSWWTASRTPAGTPSTRRPALRGHRPPRHARRPGRRPVRRRPPDLGATCSLVTSYLMEQDVPVPPQVATALLYGIETELAGYPREASRPDDDALHLPLPAGRQGPARPDPQRPAAAELLRVPAPGAAELVHLRPAHHQLGQRAAAAGAGGRGGRFHDPLRGGGLGPVRRRLRGQARSCRCGRACTASRPATCCGKWSAGWAGPAATTGGPAGTSRCPRTSPAAIEAVQTEIRRRMLIALHCEDARGQRLVPCGRCCRTSRSGPSPRRGTKVFEPRSRGFPRKRCRPVPRGGYGGESRVCTVLELPAVNDGPTPLTRKPP